MKIFTLLLFAALSLTVSLANVGVACDLSADKVSEIMGTKATTTSDGVVRVTWPRTDVKVQVDGMPLHPFLGLGTWAAFQSGKHESMVMGDTVVFQDEVNPAIDAAFAHGLEVTALHNHFFFDEPKVYFMHIGGEGCPDKLAEGVRAVWDAVKKVRAENAEPAQRFAGGTPKPGALDAGRLGEIIGSDPVVQDGMVKISLSREATMHEMKFGGSMGLTTWVAFAGSDELASIDGDFAMTGAEVQPVLQAMRKEGIHIVALHNHMINETPAYYFVHFWGKGDAGKLAEGFKRVLDAQAKVSAAPEARAAEKE